MDCNHAELDLAILDSFMDFVEPIEINLEEQDGDKVSAVLETQNGVEESAAMPNQTPSLYPDLSQLGD